MKRIFLKCKLDWQSNYLFTTRRVPAVLMKNSLLPRSWIDETVFA